MAPHSLPKEYLTQLSPTSVTEFGKKTSKERKRESKERVKSGKMGAEKQSRAELETSVHFRGQ